MVQAASCTKTCTRHSAATKRSPSRTAAHAPPLLPLRFPFLVRAPSAVRRCFSSALLTSGSWSAPAGLRDRQFGGSRYRHELALAAAGDRLRRSPLLFYDEGVRGGLCRPAPGRAPGTRTHASGCPSISGAAASHRLRSWSQGVADLQVTRRCECALRSWTPLCCACNQVPLAGAILLCCWLLTTKVRGICMLTLPGARS